MRISNFIRSFWRDLGQFAKHRVLIYILLGLFSFGMNAWRGVVQGIPLPWIHDEFSNLLAADTFAKGRLTNPTHPLWVHFETIHVIQQPTYMSPYPPMQGLMLALGKVIFGHPIFGVWLSVALMCVSIVWMLYAWVPPRWAALGGAITTLQFGLGNFLSLTYNGSAISAAGCALLFGGLRRTLRSLEVKDVLLLVLGLVILANSRPYEGLVAALVAAWVLLKHFLGPERPPFSKFVKRILLPALLVLVPSFFAMGKYNKATTSNPFCPPQRWSWENNTSLPFFVFQPLRSEPQFRHAALARFEREFHQRNYFYKRTAEGFFEELSSEATLAFLFYFFYPLALPLTLFLTRMVRNSWMQLAITVILLVLLAHLLTPFLWHPRYGVPFLGLTVVIVIQGLRHLYCVKKIHPSFGRLGVLLLLAVFLTGTFQAKILRPFRAGKPIPSNGNWCELRDRMVKELEAKDGKHLVLVRYDLEHYDSFDEWVYNEADIDASKIVWAREMDSAENQKLLDYFKDRRVWLLEARNSKTVTLQSLAPSIS